LIEERGAIAVAQERGHEIGRWLLDYAERLGVKSFVILDDDTDMAGHKNRLVKTDHTVGLTASDVAKAILVLRRPI